MTEYLLDTNAVIAILNHDVNIAPLLAQPNTAFVPIIAVGELYFGAEKSGYTEANVKRIDEFISRRRLLMCDLQTAREYGRIERQLRTKGRPIPQNDLWIAAIALQYSLILLTRDAHFQAVDGLAVQGG